MLWSRAGEAGSVRPSAAVLPEDGARVFTAQRGADAEFEWIAADFTDPDSPEQVIARVIARAGRLDVLANNAGMMQEACVEAMSLADWQRNLAVNLTTPFLMIRAALPHLRASRGSIVGAFGRAEAGLRRHHRRRRRPWAGDRLLPRQGARITNVAVLEKGWLGGGNTGRNTTIIRSNYLCDESAASTTTR